MISPVNIISFKLNKFSKYQKNTNNPINYKFQESLNLSFPIPFLGKLNVIPSFEETCAQNWFQLGNATYDNKTYQFKPDESQIDCAKVLYQGNSLLFCAPTGTGKTAIINYAITKNLNEGKETKVLMPLKALSNDKYREFVKLYGKDNVGILTGDIKYNQNAPVVLMTTEIFEQQVTDENYDTSNTGTVVFDEAHYLGDIERGLAWENSIIGALKRNIPILCLSATIGNKKDYLNWISSINPDLKAENVNVDSQERYVPLQWCMYNCDIMEKNEIFPRIIKNYITLSSLNNPTAIQKRGIEEIYREINSLNTFEEISPSEFEQFKQILIETCDKNFSKKSKISDAEFMSVLRNEFKIRNKRKLEQITLLISDIDSKYVKQINPKKHCPSYANLICDLRSNDMLPALIFRLSRKKCDDIIDELSIHRIDLTTPQEKIQIKNIVNEYQKQGVYLDATFDFDSLIRGYASHHAGKMPQYKKLIEDLFSKKLLKVVCATSTLSAGINMPAKTVVMSDMHYKEYNPTTKSYQKEPLSVNEFHQMAGRAGRRGIDELGYVVLYNIEPPIKNSTKDSPQINDYQLAYELLTSTPDRLHSNFRPEADFLARYFTTHQDFYGLYDILNNTFKVQSAKDKDKALKQLYQKFVTYSQILLKEGYAYRDYKNNIFLTAKGRALAHAQGINPLMVCSLTVDEKLRGLKPIQLCQIAGYVAGADYTAKNSAEENIVTSKLAPFIKNSSNKVVNFTDFKKVREMYEQKEIKINRRLNEAKVPDFEITYSDDFSGGLTYLWAYLNMGNDNSVSNFKKLSSTYLSSANLAGMDKKLKNDYEMKSSQGSAYRIITQSISVLKQIQRICIFALNDEELSFNEDYYKELYKNCEQAIELINKNPIYSETIV